jgi:hypothetical protein
MEKIRFMNLTNFNTPSQNGEYVFYTLVLNIIHSKSEQVNQYPKVELAWMTKFWCNQPIGLGAGKSKQTDPLNLYATQSTSKLKLKSQY